MSISINTNVAAANAERNLNKVQLNLNKSFERLSSGLRINRAADDAGRLAIAERFTGQIRGLGQAVRNANDGISLLQTAEGALQETSSILQRMRELAVQGANGIYDASNRDSLQGEADNLLAEINRIADDTTFNGRKILDGSFTGLQLQVGADAGETIDININGAQTDDMGQIASKTGTATTGASTGSNLTLNGVDIVASTVEGNGKIGASAYQLAKAINGSNANVRAEAQALTQTVDVSGGFSADMVLTINDVDVFDGTGNSTTAQGVADEINVFTSQTGVTATVNGTNMELSTADGRSIVIANKAGTTNPFANGTTNSTIKLTSNKAITLDAGNALIGFTGTSITLDTKAIKDIDLTTAAGATEAIDRLDAALTSLSSDRGDLGSVQNRLDSTISNLSNVSENLTAARSRLIDVDFASETVELTKGQLLQQAGVAILSQAKAGAQIAASLLQ